MDIIDIVDRYDLDARARGYSEKTICHVKASVRYFSQYLGDIEDLVNQLQQVFATVENGGEVLFLQLGDGAVNPFEDDTRETND